MFGNSCADTNLSGQGLAYSRTNHIANDDFIYLRGVDATSLDGSFDSGLTEFNSLERGEAT
jgi:hypothetical protein